jgi:hypothetical protein
MRKLKEANQLLAERDREAREKMKKKQDIL